MPKTPRRTVSFDKEFYEKIKKLGPHPSWTIKKTFKERDNLKELSKKQREEIISLRTRVKELEEGKSVTEPSPKEKHPCQFHFYLEKEDKVLCSKDWDKRGSIHTISREVCDQCWARRQKTREVQQQAPVKVHPCEFYHFDNKDMKVHCSRDFAKKGVTRNVTQKVCDACWEYKIKPIKQQMDKAHALFQQAMTGNNPFENVPCPHECREIDKNMQLIFCAKNLKPPITDRKIHNRQIYNVERCRQCVDTYKRAQELKTVLRAKRAKNAALNRMPRVNWGKAEGGRL
jgi:hypothetical protein